jgi:hypothetical protein
VPSTAGFHDGIAATGIATQNAGGIVVAKKMNNVDVAGGGGEHQSCLMGLVEGWTGVLVASSEEGLADIAVAEGSGKV